MFTFPLDSAEIFLTRSHHFAAWGIPRASIACVRGRVRDMWSDGAGGWVHEWSREAQRHERRAPLLAALLYGAAKFPCQCTVARREALQLQVACYLRAARGFSVHFTRRVISVATGARKVDLPVHGLLPNSRSAAPVVLLSGGVDTGKIELHRLALWMARAGLRVFAIDMPGTGETPGPLTEDADELYAAVLDALLGAEQPRPRRGIFGLSFGGTWAAKLALRGRVDAAVNLGGPVGAVARDPTLVANLPHGMTGTVAHALSLPTLPSSEQMQRLLDAYSLRTQGLLDPERLAVPLLAVNGDKDAYVPLEDTLVFRDFLQAECLVVRDADHCASDSFLRVAFYVVAWLRMQLLQTRSSKLVCQAARLLLPRTERTAMRGALRLQPSNEESIVANRPAR